jgi:hypothetical protein
LIDPPTKEKDTMSSLEAWRGRALASSLALLLMTVSAHAQNTAATLPGALTSSNVNGLYGPYSGTFLEGGIGLSKPLREHEPLAEAQQDWSLTLWFKTAETAQTALLAGVGGPAETYPRYLALRDGKPVFWAGGAGSDHELESTAALAPGEWHSLAITADVDGAHLFVDGKAAASGRLVLGPASAAVELAPAAPASTFAPAPTHFGGLLGMVSLRTGALNSADLDALLTPPAGLDSLPFEEGSKPWMVQTHAGGNGLRAPQNPATLPHSLTPPQKPIAIAPLAGADHVSNGKMLLRHGWQMIDAAEVEASGEQIATANFNANGWMQATVPGTALTTLIDRGVYPDPDYGLNNMAIPDSLSTHSFWYRDVFTVGELHGDRKELTFHGINYQADIWLNGHKLGVIIGGFLHTSFDVTPYLQARNVLAVFIQPPPHPGIAHEQSISAGAGGNGGLMMLDGPTFGATEGWDWIPGIRDRNIGLWQDVELSAHNAVKLDVPQIITHLPLPDRSRAEITVRVPLTNTGASNLDGTLELAFDDVHIEKKVSAAPGKSTVEFTPSEYRQLVVEHPKLWWPNGYGDPALHTMRLSFKAGGEVSDTRRDRFGVREISYEVAALDNAGHVRNVEVLPTVAALAAKTPEARVIVNQTHEGFRETPGGWTTSLMPGMDHSPAVRDVPGSQTGTALVIRVNGVRIAIRGGSWGMDDMRKRVSRERMEPYFRLHREANVDIIRNWMGQNTEDVFYDLADEYGLLVWNDFWDSTQDYNLEPTDAALFLKNAREVIHRYRNHPSIAIWCGRNEGVPPPTINEGLISLIAEEDGTRYYSADSNTINLHASGPYKYQEPEAYFTTLSRGFAVEVGLPSPPTREAFEAFLPKTDQWPISDAWAYHDWHQDSNGDVAPFMQTIIEEFGAPTSLADFDRKAQMLNYVGHRAVFEGMNAHLWQPNSGRMLWMTQPAWPSTVWQIFSHDYDTQASFYGVKKASEPVHVQMNLPDHDVVIVNNTLDALNGLRVSASVYNTASKMLFDKNAIVAAPSDETTPGLELDLDAALRQEKVLLVKLSLADAQGKLLSDNFYWVYESKSDMQKLNSIASVGLTATATRAAASANEMHVDVKLSNNAGSAAIATKLTLVDANTGERILPAYYSDNYVSLLPGASKTISIAFPADKATKAMKVALRGWNVQESSVPVR